MLGKKIIHWNVQKHCIGKASSNDIFMHRDCLSNFIKNTIILYCVHNGIVISFYTQWDHYVDQEEV